MTIKGVLSRSMRELDRCEWPIMPQIETEALRVWVSADYLAVLYRQRADGNIRLTVNSTRRNSKGRWRDGITWDELQRVKQECLGDVWAVECYPPEQDVINVSNMRHLFVLDEAPETRFPSEAVCRDLLSNAKRAVRHDD